MNAYCVKRDGKKLFEGTENECWEYIQKNTSYSFDHATKYEGWSVEQTTEAKNAVVDSLS